VCLLFLSLSPAKIHRGLWHRYILHLHTCIHTYMNRQVHLQSRNPIKVLPPLSLANAHRGPWYQGPGVGPPKHPAAAKANVACRVLERQCGWGKGAYTCFEMFDVYYVSLCVHYIYIYTSRQCRVLGRQCGWGKCAYTCFEMFDVYYVSLCVHYIYIYHITYMINIHTCITYLCMYAYVRKRGVCIPAYIHTYTHTYIHT
jgi:hypothetical protein